MGSRLESGWHGPMVDRRGFSTMRPKCARPLVQHRTIRPIAPCTSSDQQALHDFHYYYQCQCSSFKLMKKSMSEALSAPGLFVFKLAYRRVGPQPRLPMSAVIHVSLHLYFEGENDTRRNQYRCTRRVNRTCQSRCVFLDTSSPVLILAYQPVATHALLAYSVGLDL